MFEQAIKDIVPDSIKINWTLKDLPIKQLADIDKNTAMASLSQPEMGSLAALSLLVKIPAILAQSGTVLKITDNYIAGPDFKITFDGLAKSDLSAVNSLSVDANMRFEGLEILLARMNTLKNNPDFKEEQKQIEDAIKRLETAKSIGRIEDETAENPVYLYKFEVRPDGKILLNGENATQALKQSD